MQQQGENPDPDGSGVSRESHAPFCEGLAGKFRRSTLPSPTRREQTILFFKFLLPAHDQTYLPSMPCRKKLFACHACFLIFPHNTPNYAG